MEKDIFFWKEALLKLPLLFIFVARMLLYDEYYEFWRKLPEKSVFAQWLAILLDDWSLYRRWNYDGHPYFRPAISLSKIVWLK